MTDKFIKELEKAVKSPEFGSLAKLNELIDEHGRRVLFAGHDMSKDKTLIYNLNKSKQAILDYVITLRNEWFNRGLKAGKISNNSSGCCCVFEADGETITNMCAPHKAMIETGKQEALKPIREMWEKWILILMA